MTNGMRPSNVPLQRLQARGTVKPVNFICIAPQASHVAVVGDFNDWSPGANPMTRHVDGSWHASIPFKHGGHAYQFMVDGQPTNDPRAQGLTRNAKGDKVSMLFVS
jgi:1,4-alpha-glucan branching enzyme